MSPGWLDFSVERQPRPDSAVMFDMGKNAQSTPAGSVLPFDLGKGIGAYIADVDFTSGDYNTVSWAAGTVKWASGVTQAVLAGSADLTSTHYFYVIYGNSTLQSSTTYSDAIGVDRVLVAIASIGSSSAINAYVFNPHTDSILINRDKVMDNLINSLKLADDAVTAAKILAGAVTAIKIDVATLDAISANVGTLTAGTIDGVTFIVRSAVAGSEYIRVYYGANQVGYLTSASGEMILAALINNIFYLHGDPIILDGDNVKVNLDSATLGNFHPDLADNYNLGSPALYWRELNVGSDGVNSQTTGLSHMYDIHPFDANTWLGASTEKYAKGYFTDLPACPVPTSNSGIEIIKKIKPPRMLEGKQGFRHYFLDEDFPDELKIDVEEKVVTEATYEKREVPAPGGRTRVKEFEVTPRRLEIRATGNREIEFVRTIGVLVQTVRELVAKTEALEAKVGV